MYGIIYKILNIQTNKIYIGQTVKTAEKRWQEHIRPSELNKRNGLLQNAIKKYGVDNFRIFVVGYCNSKKELDKSEIECISFFQSNNKKYGYNMTKGGDGVDKGTKPWCTGTKGVVIPWNKGLTAKTDDRVKEYTKKGAITKRNMKLTERQKAHLKKVTFNASLE